MLLEEQAGFRKGRGVLDNIYVLNWVVNRELKREGGKLWVFFVDLRAAFNSISRRTLWEVLDQRGVSRELRNRLGEVYGETISRIRVGEEELGQGFWSARGVRQECPLTPNLFFLLIADLEEGMGKRG